MEGTWGWEGRGGRVGAGLVGLCPGSVFPARSYWASTVSTELLLYTVLNEGVTYCLIVR